MLEEKKMYEFKDQNGFMYPKGYLGYCRELYGEGDPRVEYIERTYDENRVEPVFMEW
jgi:hypothetical protein